jgi:hypothetical protein
MVVAGVLALAAKETALVLPVLALLVAVPAPGEATRARERNRAALAGPRVIAVAALLAFLVLGGLVTWRLYGGIATLARTRLAAGPLAPQPALTLRVLGQYLLLAVWPAGLSADYTTGAFPLPQSAIDGPSLAAGAALFVVLVAGVVLLTRRSPAGVGLLWFLVALAPVSQLVPYREVVSEHNAYLPVAGLALAFGSAAGALFERRPRLGCALLAIMIVVLGTRAHLRTRVWRSDLTLWSATAASRPEGMRAHYNFGVALLASSRLFDARKELERAHALAPEDRDVLLALATVDGKIGDFPRSIELASRALAQRQDYSALTVLGWSQIGAGEAEKALSTFQRALELVPGGEDAQRGIATAKARGGRF